MQKARSKARRARLSPRSTKAQLYRTFTVVILAGLAALAALYFSSRLVVSPTPADAPTATATIIATATPLPTATASLTPATVLTATQALTTTPSLSPTTSAAVAPASPVTVSTSLSTAPPVFTYEVVQVYPHDPNAFTQGLLFNQGQLYEGTGLNGRSSLRRVELSTGNVLQQVDLAEEYFGEGITILGDQIYQLTWQSQVGFIYDKNTLEKRQEFTYPTEGWGITHDGARLIMSDGTPTLYFRDPSTLAELSKVEVYDNTGPVARLNELEFVQGEVYANIWQTDRIARIDPATGQVVGWIDLTGLLPAAERSDSNAVLNGIAYLPDENRLFVTGKLWPKLFEIKLLPQP